ncbi:MAG TPA: glycosyltransferase family 2 protein [Kouleothrix sp.]|uniref:glycosyltransferase family 2 protein n=1 Tax=Kouleothrix sp. TaxID=2779161 RepID=UPI002B5BD472|nr:glycosyltransferase family 2 protein [Kouleothrix sp.]
MPTLAIIIVSWNTRELLRRAIDSARASLAGSGIGTRIVVVDNASADGTPAMLRADYPEVELIEAGTNLGFAGGNNLALRHVLSTAIDYVFLLNPDTESRGDALPMLVRYLEAHPDVAVVGPRLVYPDGSVQPSRRRFPTRGVYFWESTPLEQRWPANPWARRYRCADTPDDREQDVDWLVGAALLVRRAAVERAGLLDAGFQMYSEELEWQRRIGLLPSDIGRRIVYLPTATIVHHEGKSSEQAPARRYLNFQRSRIREARMAYGARFAGLLRWFLRAAYAAELAAEAGKWLLGHKRPLRAGRVRVYWQLLREL